MRRLHFHGYSKVLPHTPDSLRIFQVTSRSSLLSNTGRTLELSLVQPRPGVGRLSGGPLAGDYLLLQVIIVLSLVRSRVPAGTLPLGQLRRPGSRAHCGQAQVTSGCSSSSRRLTSTLPPGTPWRCISSTYPPPWAGADLPQVQGGEELLKFPGLFSAGRSPTD